MEITRKKKERSGKIFLNKQRNYSASGQDYTERLRLPMLSSVQGGKCEFMPNRMFKCRVAQGCAGTVKGK